MDWHLILLALALALFILAAFGVNSPRINLTALGLAALTGAFIVATL